MAFIASLVQSLAWPAGVVAVVVILRKSIKAVLSQVLLRRLKAGPLEVEFDQVQAEVQKELARSPELADTQVPPPLGGLRLSEEMSGLAEFAPKTAVVGAFTRIEERLAEILRDTDGLPSMLTWRQMVRTASDRGLISNEVRAALDGLSELRNLVAHSGGDIGVDRARDFLAIADAVMYALRPKPSAEHADQGCPAWT